MRCARALWECVSVLCFAVEVWNRVEAARAMEESVVVESVGVLRLPHHCVSPARRLFTRWRLLERGACACRLGICNGTGTFRVGRSLPWMRIRLTGRFVRCTSFWSRFRLWKFSNVQSAGLKPRGCGRKCYILRSPSAEPLFSQRAG